jgi:hypothetical protein
LTSQIVVACVKKLPASAIRFNRFAHLGITMPGQEPKFSSVIWPPPQSGRYSRQNVYGKEVVRRDLPKMRRSYYFDRPNYGDWTKGSHTIRQLRDIYARDPIPAKGLQLSIDLLQVEPGDDPLFAFRFRIDQVLSRDHPDFAEDLLFALNLLQENAGQVDVFAVDADTLQYLTTVNSVYWEILPVGQHDRLDAVERVLDRIRHPDCNVQESVRERLELLESLGPRNYVVGNSGFNRYFGAQFNDTVVAFENVEHGNAAYVMFDKWQELSKLSRTELLRNRPDGFIRIVHRQGWQEDLRQAIRQNAA